MAKRPTKNENKGDETEKKSNAKGFDNKEFKKNMGLGKQVVKEKELSWIPFKKAFHDAVGLPGVARGYTTQFRGFSDVGKSTGIYETIAGAQKLGDYVVIFDTEGSFSWEHARLVGFKYEEIVDEETGEIIDWEGDDFMYFGGSDLLALYQNFDYKAGKMTQTPQRFIPVVEDIARAMNEFMDKQAKGEFNHNITFVWDSIGSIGCYEGAVSNTNNNMWTAGALKRAFESILNFRIPASRRESAPFINTFVTVQKIWLRPNAVGQPTIMHNGGEGFKYGVRMIFHLGGKSTSSAKKLDAVNGGRSFNFGVKTDIECVKNHVNGIERMGVICSTPHGFLNPDEKNAYVKENNAFINEKLGTNFSDFEVKETDLDTNAYEK
jgi:hypothetical protein